MVDRKKKMVTLKVRKEDLEAFRKLAKKVKLTDYPFPRTDWEMFMMLVSYANTNIEKLDDYDGFREFVKGY